MFGKCTKQVKFGFLSFTNRDFANATNCGCAVMSINSNFEESSACESLVYEGRRLFEIDTSGKIEEQTERLLKVKVVLLCVNNGWTVKDRIVRMFES